MRLATTRGTNALLERSGSPTALFITRGFGDLLTIGNQQRPDLFTLNVVKTPPLYASVVEVEERMDSAGRVLRPLDLEALRPEAEAVLAEGLTVAAVALLHSYRNPDHENDLERFLRDLGFGHVSCSSALAPLIKIVPRAETAVVNAYLSGAIGQYLETVGNSIRPGPFHVMTSAGSLVQAHHYLPKDSLLSGPAGGVVGAAEMASQSGWSRSLAFDMGGTSTDVSRFDRALDYRFETSVGDVRLLSPSLAIETVAAGGGSICHFDGRQLKVGPQSAGADPGPACYGAGGPLTLTDVNLLLGRLQPESFEIPIDREAPIRAAEELLRTLRSGAGERRQKHEILQGLLDIANERMAEAVRRISIRQGYRPAEFALVAFGGAGGQHACALAEILDMDTVLVPEDAGLLSAVGLGRARVERMAERQVLRPLTEVRDELREMFDQLTRDASGSVLAEGVAPKEIEDGPRVAYLRLVGQEASLGVTYDPDGSLEENFAEAYQDHYGYRPDGAPVEVEALRAIATSGEAFVVKRAPSPRPRSIESSDLQRVFLNGAWQRVPVFVREGLRAGDCFPGPALVFESHCATVVHPGWTGEIDGYGCLVLKLSRSGEIGKESNES
jgi:5-oxoprolinase (ATP-hydrolysing)